MSSRMIPLLVALATGCASSNQTTNTKDSYQLQGNGAELYEQILVPPLFAPWADDLIERVDLKAGEKVLDVATGTGIVARKAAEIVGPTGSVTGLDINPVMLSVAQKAPAPAEPKIEWVEGDALKLPFPDGTFNVVFCQQALQFFPDRAQAIKEMYRVLAPGGRVAVSSWRAAEQNPYAIEFAKVVEQKVDPRAGQETRSPFNWDDAAEMSSTMETAGFTNVKAEPVTIEMHEANLKTFIINDLLAYPTTGKTLASWSTEQKDALVNEILEALKTYKSGESWTIPWASNVGVAHK